MGATATAGAATAGTATAATDGRLLLPALSVWIAALAAPHLGAPMSSRLAWVLGGVGLLLLVLAGGGRAGGGRAGGGRAGGGRAGGGRAGGAAVLAAALVCAAGGLLAVSLRADATSTGPLAGLARGGAGATVDAVLTGDPYALPVGFGQLWLIDARAERVRAGQRAWTLRQPVLVLASGPGWAGLLPSTRVRLPGVLAAPRPGDTVAAVVKVRGSPKIVRGPSRLQRLAGTLRSGLRHAAEPLPGRERGLLPGLVDGDTSGLPTAVAQQFRVDGLTHLVAVSGSNVVAVLGAALFLSRSLRLGRAAPAVAGLLLVGFVVLARPSPSVLRAAVMGLLAMAALATGRERPAVPALSATVLVLVLLDPGLASAPGFQLSTLASAALLLLAPGWREGLLRRGWSARAAEALSVPLAAQVVCGPVIAVFAGSVSLVAVAANLMAAPAVPFATVAGVVTAVLAPVSMPLAHCAAWVAGLPCWWLVTVAALGSKVPAAQVPWPTGSFGGLLLVVVSVLFLWALRALVRWLFPVVATPPAAEASPGRPAGRGAAVSDARGSL